MLKVLREGFLRHEQERGGGGFSSSKDFVINFILYVVSSIAQSAQPVPTAHVARRKFKLWDMVLSRTFTILQGKIPM